MQDNNQIIKKPSKWWYVVGVIAVFLSYYLIVVYVQEVIIQAFGPILYLVPVFWGLLLWIMGIFIGWNKAWFVGLKLVGLSVLCIIIFLIIITTLAPLLGIVSLFIPSNNGSIF